MRTADRLNRLLLTMGVFEWRWLRWGFATLVRVLRSTGGDARARHAMHLFGDRWVWSGRPFARGWINLHASRFLSVVERSVWGLPPVAPRPLPPLSERPLRVGMLANLHLTLGTQRPLFEAVPRESIELHLFDRWAGGSGASYLAPFAASYHALSDDSPASFAAAINRVAPDLLLSLVPQSVAFRTFEMIDTPCVASVCTSSDLLHHPRVAYHVFTQPEFGYRVRDREVFCDFTGKPFGQAPAFESWLVCDARGMNEGQRRAWHDREPLIVWHGSLYKLCSAGFLDLIVELLHANPAVRFEYFGKGPQTESIARMAKTRGVADRVQHRGVAGFARDQHGELQPDTYAALRDALSRARLWPDSFPVGGGSARFEAYVSGTPSIHMAPAADPPRGPYEDGSLLELPWLEATRGVARSRREYFELAQRCLRDAAFADTLAGEQDAVAAAVLDARAWWLHMRRGYESWRKTVAA
jgi:hypothetical protein